MKTSFRDYISFIDPWLHFVYLILICIFFVFLMLATIFNIIPDILTPFFINRPYLSILVSTLISIGLIYFGYIANNRYQYFRAIQAIFQEMKHNSTKMEEFQKNFDEAYSYNDEEFCIKRWIAKSPSLTNWGDGNNFHYKYLPSQAYFDFVNKGYINQRKYLELPVESIANFYQFCIEFSYDLQRLENCIRENKNDKRSIKISLNRFKDKEFQNSNEICNFLLKEFYPFYSDKNRFNDGIIGEFHKIVMSLEKHRWLMTK